jgi:hypothetical protein
MPHLGHYDTWTVDRAVALVRANRGVDLVPGWEVASDYAASEEKFGAVSAGEDLCRRVNALKIGPQVFERVNVKCCHSLLHVCANNHSFHVAPLSAHATRL